MTLLEGVAYGNCVIASDIPANTEVVEDNGVIFESMNVEDLCEALKMVIENPALARELGERARAHGVAEYNYDNVTAKTEALYRRVLSGEMPAPGNVDAPCHTVEENDGGEQNTDGGSLIMRP